MVWVRLYSIVLLGLIAGACSKQVKQAPPLAGSLKPVRAESQPIDQKRIIFPNSVIPGGVKTSGDVVQAIIKDPVVRQHYGNVRPDLLVPAVLTEDRAAFVSYRVANRIYWTAKRVQLKKGETVLTGGGVTIRGRCGNQVSENPQEPVESGILAPTEEELDTPVELRGPLELTQAVQGPMFANLPIAAPIPAALEEAVAPPPQLLAGALPQGGGYSPSSAIGGFGGAGGGGMPSEPSGSTSQVSNSPGSGQPGSDPPGRNDPPRPFHFTVPPPSSGPAPSRLPGNSSPPPGSPPPYYPPSGGPPPSAPPPTGWPPPGNPQGPPPPYHPPDLPPHGPPPPYDPPSAPPPVESIPEPGTYLITAVGLIGFALYKRRKRGG